MTLARRFGDRIHAPLSSTKQLASACCGAFSNRSTCEGQTLLFFVQPDHRNSGLVAAMTTRTMRCSQEPLLEALKLNNSLVNDLLKVQN